MKKKKALLKVVLASKKNIEKIIPLITKEQKYFEKMLKKERKEYII